MSFFRRRFLIATIRIATASTMPTTIKGILAIASAETPARISTSEDKTSNTQATI
ncbi:hypothetical protein [Methanobrevibacter sp.]|uniref:hypothetical protein n=1 Tax=Methanobrevibacter sp. TaxID=66852 RepID=UPI003870E5BC